MVQNTPANRKHKDSFFTKLFSEPKRLVGAYNAISTTNYPLDTPIEINTLENVFYLDRYNDVSFIIDGRVVVLIEHQSTVNPNIAMRLWIYLGKIYDKLIKKEDIYSTQLIKFPRPELIVLYDGLDEQPDETNLMLSDSFFDKEVRKNGWVDASVRVLNINKGHNSEIVQGSPDLNGYVFLANEIRQNRKTGLELKEAINKAILACKEQNVLTDFLEKYGGEVIDMLHSKWDLDEYVTVVKRDAELRGGQKKAASAAIKALEKGMSIEDAADISGLSIEEVEALVMG